MSGLYANKYTIELSDVGRIIFADERAPAAEGLPMSSATVAEIVMTVPNLIALAEHLQMLIAKHEIKVPS
jgi:hypothetical protein